MFLAVSETMYVVIWVLCSKLLMPLQGLVWVLNMYLKAECPDYRWIHDNEAPSMHQLVEAIKALKKPQARAARVRNALQFLFVLRSTAACLLLVHWGQLQCKKLTVEC